ncbi:MAG: hypothetical protein Q9M91_00590 [Candidatus Dojkabacteria bacterium]|nr:hypothetical protein [Candidatus Dojkabacteria bacterium]MDQ7020327.1 hypothetical protein [Candidatus Dojkabacteria bacterium]
MDHSVIKDLLWRALTDTSFREILVSDFESAVKDHELSDEDKALLKKVVNDKPGQIDDLGSYLSQVLSERDNKGFIMAGG